MDNKDVDLEVGMDGFAVSLTYDVEMCTNFPYWSSVWDHRKGAIDPDTKAYVGRLAEAAAQAGVRLQGFVVGAAVADEEIDYLHRWVAAGHALGNHTWRHVNLLATTFEQLQVTYRDDPSLADGHATPLDAMRAEIRATTEVLVERLGTRPLGFRTPGGFSQGLAGAPAAQDLLRDEGFAYCSSDYRYPHHRLTHPTFDELAAAQRETLDTLQPYRYRNGLLELPLTGVSDIGAFRGLDLERETWFRLIEVGIDHAAERGLLFSVLMHPAVQAVRDPHAALLERVLARVDRHGGRLVTNDEVAAAAPTSPAGRTP